MHISMVMYHTQNLNLNYNTTLRTHLVITRTDETIEIKDRDRQKKNKV